MNYIKIAEKAELTSGGKKKVSVGGKDILLTNIEGTYYAVENTCPHMGGSLVEGKLDGHHIVCPRHGSSFDVTTGKLFSPGKLLFIKVKPRDLLSFPVKIEGNDILVGIE
ncbi:MAG: Rieske 2Fe-2S domain-containing protein [Firmicutes bacterium]|nr:Rieske 2Fe-2S domain-containing protein [Bacillota bacterium]